MHWDKFTDQYLLNKLAEIRGDLKIIANVLDADYMQFVLADFALLTLLFSDQDMATLERGNISFGANRFTVHIPDENGNVYFVRNVDFDALNQQITDFLD